MFRKHARIYWPKHISAIFILFRAIWVALSCLECGSKMCFIPSSFQRPLGWVFLPYLLGVSACVQWNFYFFFFLCETKRTNSFTQQMLFHSILNVENCHVIKSEDAWRNFRVINLLIIRGLLFENVANEIEVL